MLTVLFADIEGFFYPVVDGTNRDTVDFTLKHKLRIFHTDSIATDFCPAK